MPLPQPVRGQRGRLRGGAGAPGGAAVVPTTVLLHGLGGSARQWREVSRRSPPGQRWIAIDLPGHGDSPLPATGPLPAVSARLDQLLAETAGDRPVGVVGHSLGGLVALHLALSRPDRVAWLGLLASAARVTLHPELRAQLQVGAVRADFLGACFASPVAADTLALVVDDFARARLDAADVWGTDGTDLRPHLASVTAPALVMAAGADVVISPRKSRELARLLPNAALAVLEGRGHYAHLEAPDEVAALIAGAQPV